MATSDPGDGVIIRRPGETESVPLPRVNYLASGGEANGAYALYEGIMLPPGRQGPSLHRHHHTDEGFYVLEGTVTFQIGARRVEAPAGTFIFIPRGIPHAFGNEGTSPTKALVLISPPGFENSFREMHALRLVHPDGPPDPAEIAALKAKYDVEYLLPGHELDFP